MAVAAMTAGRDKGAPDLPGASRAIQGFEQGGQLQHLRGERGPDLQLAEHHRTGLGAAAR